MVIHSVMEPNARVQIFGNETKAGRRSPSKVKASTLGNLHPRKIWRPTGIGDRPERRRVRRYFLVSLNSMRPQVAHRDTESDIEVCIALQGMYPVTDGRGGK